MDRELAKPARRRVTSLRFVALLLAAVGCFVSAARAEASGRTAEAVSPPSEALFSPGAFASVQRVAAWPPWLRQRRSPPPDVPAIPDAPHPAVARIIVPEGGATAYGSGTLIDVRDQFGLVITNWHVVRDSTGTVEVVFPDGFRSHARPLKVDTDWDLAALVIWRPAIEPVRVAQFPPRPGELLTIHGYGQGKYRIATGRCTAYYAPKVHFPLEMVELDVEARQGDSGGPIFNQRGELAGVLFGAGEGTTIGSYAPRVESFLATLAPDIGQVRDQAQVAVADRPAPQVHPRDERQPAAESSVTQVAASPGGAATRPDWPSSSWGASASSSPTTASDQPVAPPIAGSAAANEPVSWSDVAGSRWYDGLKSILAVVGLVTVALQLVRMAR